MKVILIALLFLVIAAPSYGNHDHVNIEKAPLILSLYKNQIDEETLRVFASGEYGYIIYSDDLAQSWHHADTPTTQTLTSMSFTDAKTGYAVGHDTIILKTVDHGMSWFTVYHAPKKEQPLFKIIENKGDLYAIGAFGLFMVSYDQGQNWHEIKLSDKSLHFYDIIFVDDETFYIVGEAGTFLKGKTQAPNQVTTQTIKTPYNGSYFGLFQSDDKSKITIYGLRGHICTYDLTTQKIKELMNHEEFSLQSHASLSDSNYIVGQSGCILRGTSQTDHYECIGMSENENFNAILLLSQDEVILSSDQGLRSFDLRNLKKEEKHK